MWIICPIVGILSIDQDKIFVIAPNVITFAAEGEGAGGRNGEGGRNEEGGRRKEEAVA